ncbi:hypothetical protein [Actinomadura kijaniata]|uniref:hypothetical protein n=1 Tax=Actinomadura kijaniata TaxID=46161 RepID=UPI0008359BAA|nr:hypothetical protein [Actinomadura kijaniata]
MALLPEPRSETGYLIDGHHKLAAYLREGPRPPVICLAPDPPLRPLREDVEGLVGHFAEIHPQAAEAAREVRWYASHWEA